MLTDRKSLLEEVMWRGAIRDESQAAAVLDGALQAVATQVSPTDAKALAARLPRSLASALERREHLTAVTPEALFARLATSEHVSVGLAIEHARAACWAIAQALDSEGRAMLAARLPPAWAALFAPPAQAPEAETRGTRPGHGHTLATGRAGSGHPLAEARPRGAQPESVVVADNPHAATRILERSRRRGRTTDRDRASGSDRFPAEARDERRTR